MKKLAHIFLMVMICSMCLAIRPTAMNKIPAFAYSNFTDLLPRDGTDDNFAVVGDGATMAYDATELSPWDGAQSIKIHADTVGNSTYTITFDGGATKQVGSHIGIVFKTSDISALIDQLWIRFQLDGEYYRFRPTLRQSHYGLQDNEWSVIWMPQQFSNNNSGPAGLAPWCTTETNQEFTFNRLYLQFNSPPESVDVWLGGVLSHTPEKGIIVFRFDDSQESIYDYVFPRFKAKGWTGTVGVITDSVGNAGSMTLAQLQELHAAGWDIGNHTTDHSALTGAVTPETFYGKIAGGKKYLCDNGMARAADVFIPPGNVLSLDDGQGGDHLERHATIASAACSRSAYGNISIDGELFNRHTGSIIPADWLNLPYFDLYGSSGWNDYTIASQAFVQSIVNERSVGIVYTHKIVPAPASGTNNSEEFFDVMVADVAAKEAAGLLEVITFTEWKNRIDSGDPIRRKTTLPRGRARYDARQLYE